MRLPQYSGFCNVQDLLNAETSIAYHRLSKAMGMDDFEDLITAFFTSNYEFTDTSAARKFQSTHMKWVREEGLLDDLKAVVSTILDFSDNTKRFYEIGQSAANETIEMYGYDSTHPYYDGYVNRFLTFLDNIADEPELRMLIKSQHLLDGVRDSVANEYSDRFYAICGNSLIEKLSHIYSAPGIYEELPQKKYQAFTDAISLGVSRGVVDTMVNPRQNQLGQRAPNYERHVKGVIELMSALGISNQYPAFDAEQTLIEGASSTKIGESSLMNLANPHFSQAKKELTPYQNTILTAIRKGTSNGVSALIYNGQTRLIPDFIYNAREIAMDSPLGLIIEQDIERGILDAVDLAYTNQESGYSMPQTYRDGVALDLYQEAAAGDLTVDRLFGLKTTFIRFPDIEDRVSKAIDSRHSQPASTLTQS